MHRLKDMMEPKKYRLTHPNLNGEVILSTVMGI